LFLEALLPIANGEVSPDATLAQWFRQKDVRAFEQLYDCHSRIVYRLLLRIVQPAGTAEEVARTLSSSPERKTGQYCDTPMRRTARREARRRKGSRADGAP